ncbi:MAG: nucleotidyl transferase AbiEii/AbiGii toxin family protein [Sphingomonadales bacterium]|nr:nucleotidyl transferase AbiEii/AbiGii toxin family protein [Sphingomonadales bacterium]
MIADTLPPMEDGISGKERDRRTKALKTAAQTYVESIALPELAIAIERALGTKDGWEVVLDPDDRDAQTILFRYPKLLNYGRGFGSGLFGVGAFGEGEDGASSRGRNSNPARAVKPNLRKPERSRPISQPNFPMNCPMRRCRCQRYRWSAPFGKGDDPPRPPSRHKLLPEMSRHYYDTMMLAAKGIDDAAKQKPDLLAKVVLNKSLMFADNKASYGTAKLGTLRLAPNDELRARLADDYAAMSEMFMMPPPSFDELMAAISALKPSSTDNPRSKSASWRDAASALRHTGVFATSAIHAST